MRRFIVVGALFLTGCGNVLGPFAARKPERIDDPMLTIAEQQARTRDRLALVDESNIKQENLSPRTYTDRPSPTGR